MIKSIFFDMDETLIDLDTEEFLNLYYMGLCEHFEFLKEKAKPVVKGIIGGLYAMEQNNGKKTNRIAFKEYISPIIPFSFERLENEMFKFYASNIYDKVLTTASIRLGNYNMLEELKNKGYKLFLTTNPAFPEIAITKRLNKGGCKADVFDYITTYENSSYTKPHVGYYEEVLKKFNLDPSEVLMVGNDVASDIIPAQEAGMCTYIVEDKIINKNNLKYDSDFSGSFENLISYMKKLPTLLFQEDSQC